MKHSSTKLLSLLVGLLGGPLAVACHVETLNVACPEGGCDCIGDACTCPDAGDCQVDCRDACDLHCAGSGDCTFSCGQGCSAQCSGSGNCDLAVGPESDVRCTGAGNCEVVCFGPCSVECLGNGDCNVACEAEQGPAPEGPISCDASRLACGPC